MTIEFTCPNGHQLRVSRRYAGKWLRCPECFESHQCPADAAREATEDNKTDELTRGLSWVASVSTWHFFVAGGSCGLLLSAVLVVAKIAVSPAVEPREADSGLVVSDTNDASAAKVSQVEDALVHRGATETPGGEEAGKSGSPAQVVASDDTDPAPGPMLAKADRAADLEISEPKPGVAPVSTPPSQPWLSLVARGPPKLRKLNNFDPALLKRGSKWVVPLFRTPTNYRAFAFDPESGYLALPVDDISGFGFYHVANLVRKDRPGSQMPQSTIRVGSGRLSGCVTYRNGRRVFALLASSQEELIVQIVSTDTLNSVEVIKLKLPEGDVRGVSSSGAAGDPFLYLIKQGGLFRLNLETRETSYLSQKDQYAGPGTLAVSPDGTTIAFTHRKKSGFTEFVVAKWPNDAEGATELDELLRCGWQKRYSGPTSNIFFPNNTTVMGGRSWFEDALWDEPGYVEEHLGYIGGFFDENTIARLRVAQSSEYRFRDKDVPVGLKVLLIDPKTLKVKRTVTKGFGYHFFETTGMIMFVDPLRKIIGVVDRKRLALIDLAR